MRDLSHSTVRTVTRTYCTVTQAVESGYGTYRDCGVTVRNARPGRNASLLQDSNQSSTAAGSQEEHKRNTDAQRKLSEHKLHNLDAPSSKNRSETSCVTLCLQVSRSRDADSGPTT